jgi:hypothetical protein
LTVQVIFYTTGYYSGTVDFDPGAGTNNLTSVGAKDIFISKLDSAGNFLWAKSMGGNSNFEESFSIAIDGSGNAYTTGRFSGTADFDPGAGTSNLTSAGNLGIFISKLDSAGNFIWAKSIGGVNSFSVSFSIALDGFGNVYTTGAFTGTADFDPGAGTSNLTSAGFDDIFISKLDSAGNFLWAKRMGGTDPDGGRSIAVDGSGNIYTLGSFIGTADFNPGAGTSNLTSAGIEDIYISKLSDAGNFLWAKRMGATNADVGRSISVDGSGNVYTTGTFEGTVDFDSGPGTSNLTSAGFDDIFISKLDAAGNFLWAKKIGGTSGDVVNSLVVDGSGNVYTTGYFQTTVDFDPGPGTSNLTCAGASDIFILKLGAASVGILDNGFGNSLKVYPNPSMGAISIDLGTSYDDVSVIIRNQLGQAVLKESYRGLNVLRLNLLEAAGMYFLEVSYDNKRTIVKVVKE